MSPVLERSQAGNLLFGTVDTVDLEFNQGKT